MPVIKIFCAQRPDADACERLAQTLRVEVPIIEHVYRVVHEAMPPSHALERLMARELSDELQL